MKARRLGVGLIERGEREGRDRRRLVGLGAKARAAGRAEQARQKRRGIEAGDLAGDPLRDDDYLVLSTVHSAKGQEWDAVYLLCVADGSFPSEFATGDPAGIDEERRLLYVAMTRARDWLYLMEPQRYYVTAQSRRGDRHVYGARSRFLEENVLACLERRAFRRAEPGDTAGCPETDGGARLDLARRALEMW